MTSFNLQNHEFQIQFRYMSIEINIYCVNRELCFLHISYNTLLSMFVKNDKNVASGVLPVNDKNVALVLKGLNFIFDRPVVK